MRYNRQNGTGAPLEVGGGGGRRGGLGGMGRGGARKRLRSASANGTRLAPPACSELPERTRMGTRIPQRWLCGLGRHAPRRHRTDPAAKDIRLISVRWPAPKCRNRLQRCLVQIGGAPTTQAAHPDPLRALGAHTGRSRHMGFWGGVVGTDRHDGGQPLRTPSAAPALGWAPWVGVRPPMHTDLPGKQNRPFRAPRANSPCRIALYPGGHRYGPHRGVRRDPGVYSRLIRVVSTRQTTQSCIDPAFWAEPFWRGPGAGPRRRKVLRPDRQIKQVSADVARSPPARYRLVSRTQCE
jgi:hypothetical protein